MKTLAQNEDNDIITTVRDLPPPQLPDDFDLKRLLPLVVESEVDFIDLHDGVFHFRTKEDVFYPSGKCHIFSGYILNENDYKIGRIIIPGNPNFMNHKFDLHITSINQAGDFVSGFDLWDVDRALNTINHLVYYGTPLPTDIGIVAVGLGSIGILEDIYVDFSNGMKVISYPIERPPRVGFVFDDGLKSYSTIVADAIRTVRGELQLDIERGVPYFETVFKSVNGIDIWKNDVRKRVLEFPFVKSIDSLEASYSNRKLEYTMRLTTDAGEMTVTQ